MDETSGPARQPGGTVEPIKRSATAAGRPRPTTQDPPGREYELYDPFAGVRHRARTFDEMVAKADQAQAIRFTAIDADGTRTDVHKVDGKWERPAPPKILEVPERDPAMDPDRPATRAAAELVRDEAPSSANVVPLNAGPRPIDAASAGADAQSARALEVAKIEAALHERYVIKHALLKFGSLQLGQTEYRFRGDTTRVAFTESNARLATDTNSPSVARSMVDVAQARNWRGMRVSGSEDFKRLVWLEASVRGVRTVGYEPVPGDLELLRKEREARQVNRIEPLPERQLVEAGTAAPPASVAKPSERSGGRKAVLAALEAVLIDRKVPERQREAVMAAAAESLARRTAAGQTHRIKVYDRAAPPQRPMTVPTPEVQRSRDRAQPAPTR